MNFSLMREVYGHNAWLVDSQTLPALIAIRDAYANGLNVEIPEQKYNSINFLDTENATLIKDGYDFKNKDFTDGIGVINLDGAITVGGGASSRGMVETSNMMYEMAKDNRVKGFIIYTNSGGGSSAAVQIMSDTINEIKQTKPVIALIKKGGLAASAAYGIISAADSIYSEDKMNIVGSIGTMIQFEGKAANSKDKNGVKTVRVYATKSTKKNLAMEEALNNDNYDLLLSEVLDPINENFINLIESNRPVLKGTNFDDGHTVFSKDGIGTFIDGLATFNEVVNMITNKNKYSLINNSETMTKSEFKNAHPDVYSQILQEGVQAERERVSSLMVYASADLDTVTNCIENGTEITPSQREKFLVKMNASSMLQNLGADSNKPATVEETKSVITEDVKKVNEELESAFNFKV